jgi:cytochrome c peroxidase
MPPFNFQPAELDGLVAFIRTGFDVGGGAVSIGEAARGQALFEGKGACTSCHRVNGHGPRVAPDLSDIGAIRSPAQLQVADRPCDADDADNRPVRIDTRRPDHPGRRLNEDTYTVQLIDEGTTVSLDRRDPRVRARKTSPMPPATRTLERRTA